MTGTNGNGAKGHIVTAALSLVIAAVTGYFAFRITNAAELASTQARVTAVEQRQDDMKQDIREMNRKLDRILERLPRYRRTGEDDR